MDYLNIGPVPANESCQQVGTPGYDAQKARVECRLFIAAIRKHLGREPEGASLVVRSNPHDFGTYYEVACRYDENNEAAVDYAFKCEAEAPVDWPKGWKEALEVYGSEDALLAQLGSTL